MRCMEKDNAEKEKLVAIILVNYNGTRDTLTCLESLKNISYENYYVIVVDNYSKKNEIDLLKKSQSLFGFEMLTAESNRGFSAGNNLGIQKALEKGAEYILLLNNDTVVHVDFLKNLLRAFDEDEKCGIATGTIYFENDRKKVWCAGGKFNDRTFKASMLGYGKRDYKVPNSIKDISFATGCCMCIKSNVVREIGMLDEDFFLYEEDTEFCFRARKNGWKIKYSPESVIYHKVSASTGGGEKASPITQYYMVRNKFLFIKRYADNGTKVKAYVHSLAMYGYYCVKGYMGLFYVYKGFKDFLKNVKGKVDIKSL